MEITFVHITREKSGRPRKNFEVRTKFPTIPGRGELIYFPSQGKWLAVEEHRWLAQDEGNATLTIFGSDPLQDPTDPIGF